MKKKAIIRGYVQAGGGSRRFGKDKALVVLNHQTMLVRSTELVRSACGNVKIVSANGKYENPPAEIVKDGWPGEGPLGGILSALYETATTSAEVQWNLMVGCDMPFLTREWLAFLCDRANESKAQVVVAESENGLEPLCACWKAEGLPALQAAFDSGIRKVTEAMKRVPMEVLDEPSWKRFDTDGRLFWNMNTPEDFEEARRIIEIERR
jgi:molybdopterin-guanine dinucleotide biosynthesis protein A